MHTYIEQINNLKIFEVDGARAGTFSKFILYSVETFDKRVLEIFETRSGAESFCYRTKDFIKQ